MKTEPQEQVKLPNCSCGAQVRWSFQPLSLDMAVLAPGLRPSFYSCNQCLVEMIFLTGCGVQVWPIMGRDGRQVRLGKERKERRQE